MTYHRLTQGTDEFISDLAAKLDKTTLSKPQPFHFIDSEPALGELIDILLEQPTNPPSLYLDLEGENLSRQGTISILQILIVPRNLTYLIDIHTLSSKAFSTSGSDPARTLKTILESASVPKVFFDVRNDSDALYSHFDIRLAGVHDLQVMEFATRRMRGRFVSGLSRCIERDLAMTPASMREWQAVKEKGKKLFAPECGGSYDVFNRRPLENDVALYCVEDVKLMPMLWELYSARLSPGVGDRVVRATVERVRESQSKSCVGHGSHKAIGPW